MADADVAAAMAGSFLGRLSPDLVGELLGAGDRIDYPAGSTIYREGATPRTLLVVRGLFRVYMSSPEGRQVTIRYARASDVLGIAVLVGGPAEVGVQTVAESTAFRIDARRACSDTPRPTSTPRSSPTRTRTTSAGFPS